MKDQFPLNETEQAQLNALRERMEAEGYERLAATKNDEDRAYEDAIRARNRGGND